MQTPQISVITWNGGFRESFHTVDFFADQTYPPQMYEFIWVEYGTSANDALRKKIEHVSNARLILLNKTDQWHVGRCINAGIKESRGDFLVIVDGDIAVKPDFLEHVWQVHRKYDNLILYFRRWDESHQYARDLYDHGRKISSSSIEYLERVCELNVASNYGGCLTGFKKNLLQVGGYEEHPVYSGPGSISYEMYIRLRNAGFPIMWHPTQKIFHPWHAGTLQPTDTPQQLMQAWVNSKRELNLDVKADVHQVTEYLRSYPDENVVSCSRCGTPQPAMFFQLVKMFIKKELLRIFPSIKRIKNI